MKKAAIRRELRKVVDEASRRLGVPGVAIGIVSEGDELCAGFGVTNIEFPSPVDAETLFLIGSTTKTLTGTVVMRLVDDGLLALDAPVRQYLPRFRVPDEDVAARVTVRHLLTHTAGWSGDYFDDLGRGDDALRRTVVRMAKKVPQLTPLGAVWAYNNASFYVLGHLIEAVTKKPYETVVREMLLGPLGMTRSFFFTDETITHKHALGHVRTPDGLAVARPYTLSRNINAAGGLASTAVDQMRYARFHLGDGTAPDGTKVLRQDTLDAMKEPQARAGSMCEAVGITWLLERVGDVDIVKHGGSLAGQMSAFVMVPERGFALTVLTNSDRGHELDQAVTDWALEHVAGVRRRKPRVLKLPPERLAEYAGRYRSQVLPGFLEITVSRGRLVLTTVLDAEALAREPQLAAALAPPMRAAMDEEDGALLLDPPAAGYHLEFLRDDHGRIEWLRHGGRIARRVD